jgi:hypothetical protein
MTSLAGRLRHLREHVEQGKLQKLILLRDPRTPISPGAKATQKHLDELRKHDAEYHRPSVEALAALEVLRSLLADAQSGDLSNGGRTIEVNSVRAWLVQNLSEPLRDLANLLVTPARIGSFENGSDPDEHLDRLVSLLNERHMAPLEEVAHELNCPADQLRASIQRNPDRIGYLPGPPAVVFEKVPDSAAG